VGDDERTESHTREHHRGAGAVASPPRLCAPQAADRENESAEWPRARAHRDGVGDDQGSRRDWSRGNQAHRVERSATFAPDAPQVGRYAFVVPGSDESVGLSDRPLPEFDIIYDIDDPAQLVRSTRERLGLTQRRLALRAGTTQAAISRIERGIVSPTFATLRELMLAMGEEPVLGARRLPTGWDPAHMTSTLARTPEERLSLALSWNKMALRLADAGRSAGEDG
jgi:transcriptional regulator with XRE-family HTH domain